MYQWGGVKGISIRHFSMTKIIICMLHLLWRVPLSVLVPRVADSSPALSSSSTWLGTAWEAGNISWFESDRVQSEIDLREILTYSRVIVTPYHLDLPSIAGIRTRQCLQD